MTLWAKLGASPRYPNELIGHQFGTFCNGFTNGFVGNNLVTVSSHFGSHLAATFQHPVYNGFRPVFLAHSHFDPAILVHVPSLAADEGFVHFNLCSGATYLRSKEIVLHGQTNPLQHEPRRLLAYLQIAGDLVGTNSVLAVRQHPSCGEPLVQRDRAIFVDGSDLDGELALGVMTSTLPSASRRIELANLVGPAAGANYSAIFPPPYSDVINAVVGIREVNYCFLKAGRFGAHLVLHKPNNSKNQWASQVNYCQGKAYSVTGPEALSNAQIAQILSDDLGREISYVDLPPAQFKQALLAAGVDEWSADALIDLQRLYREGKAATVTRDVEQVLGRKPLTFEQFSRDYASAFQAAA